MTTAPTRPSPLTDRAGAATYLATTERHIKRLAYERKLTYVKIGGALRFAYSDLDAYIKANRMSGR